MVRIIEQWRLIVELNEGEVETRSNGSIDFNFLALIQSYLQTPRLENGGQWRVKSATWTLAWTLAGIKVLAFLGSLKGFRLNFDKFSQNHSGSNVQMEVGKYKQLAWALYTSTIWCVGTWALRAWDLETLRRYTRFGRLADWSNTVAMWHVTSDLHNPTTN